VAVGGARDGGVGSRLRIARRQLGLALDDLPALTGGEFTAAAVGSYERGFRTTTVERMAALCGYYNVPLVEILTGQPAPPTPPSPPAQAAAAANGVAAAQQTRALRRLAASVASRRTGWAPRRPATVSFGFATGTTRSSRWPWTPPRPTCGSWQPRPNPTRLGQPIRLAPAVHPRAAARQGSDSPARRDRAGCRRPPLGIEPTCSGGQSAD